MNREALQPDTIHELLLKGQQIEKRPLYSGMLANVQPLAQSQPNPVEYWKQRLAAHGNHATNTQIPDKPTEQTRNIEPGTMH